MQQEVKPKEGFVYDTGETEEEKQQTAAVEAETQVVPIAPLSDEWPITVRLLHKKLRVSKTDERDELTFREPTGRDINNVGNPVRIDSRGEILIDDQRMLHMMANLSGILSPVLERMDPRDYASCAYRLRNFFTPNVEAWFPSPTPNP
jgi:Phage tail assembly chaperone proteins, E, or 41 or 14